MLTGIIDLALGMMTKALKKKKGKVYAFLIKEETQKTVTDIYTSYVQVVDELEEGGEQ